MNRNYSAIIQAGYVIRLHDCFYDDEDYCCEKDPVNRLEVMIFDDLTTRPSSIAGWGVVSFEELRMAGIATTGKRNRWIYPSWRARYGNIMDALKNADPGSPFDTALASAIETAWGFARNLAVAERFEFEYQAALEEVEERHYFSMIEEGWGGLCATMTPEPSVESVRKTRRL